MNAEPIGEAAEQLLANITAEPFLPVSDRYDAIDIDSKNGTAAKKQLLHRGLIKEVEVDTGKPGRNPKLLELTDVGKQLLDDRGYDVAKTGRRGIRHRYWQQQIQAFYEEQGFEAEIEYSVGRQRIDVYASNDAETIAVEVACSPKHEVENVTKCLKQDVEVIRVACTKTEIAEKSGHISSRNWGTCQSEWRLYESLTLCSASRQFR